jgi:hypothetical protein
MGAPATSLLQVPDVNAVAEVRAPAFKLKAIKQ